MCDYCYDASARIADQTDFRKADIGKIDRFLARTHLREFKLQDVKDLLNEARLAEAIIGAYIKHKLVKKDERFYCPKHEHTTLRLPRRRSLRGRGYCHTCDERYALSVLDSETVFIREMEPDRALQAQGIRTMQGHDEPNLNRWTDKKWLVERGFQVIIILIMLANLAFNYYTFHASP